MDSHEDTPVPPEEDRRFSLVAHMSERASARLFGELIRGATPQEWKRAVDEVEAYMRSRWD